MQTSIRLSLFINYFVFAILLNSVGIVILKVQTLYGIDEVQASILELFKDMPIAIVSFAIASFLPKIGYKKAMISGLLLVLLGCMVMYFGNAFWSSKLLFVLVGVGFALIKVSVYATIGLITDTEQEHNSLMSSIEGVFMFGIASAYFIFPFFNSETQPDGWLNVYLFLALLVVISIIVIWRISFISEQHITKTSLRQDMSAMFGLLAKIMVVVFVFAAFLFVMIEQGIMTWLPTFNARVLQLPQNVSIMMASILALSLGIGRLLAGQLVKKYHWFMILVCCIILAALMVIFILPRTTTLQVGTIDTLRDVPLMAYAFPLVGLFIAPIYPLLNSAVLSALPKNLHSPMTGLIVIFSALGGTLGSRLIGWLFKNVGASDAFYYTLLPMGGLLICLIALRKLTQVNTVHTDEI